MWGRAEHSEGKEAGGQPERWCREERPDPCMLGEPDCSGGREPWVDSTEVLSLYTDGDHLERFKGALNLSDEKQFCPGLDWGDMAEMCYQEDLEKASVNFKDE